MMESHFLASHVSSDFLAEIVTFEAEKGMEFRLTLYCGFEDSASQEKQEMR